MLFWEEVRPEPEVRYEVFLTDVLGLFWSRSIDSFDVLGVVDFYGITGSEFASSLS